jgi:hypothetical protein
MRPIQLANEHGRDIESTTIMAGEPGAGSLEIEVASGLGPVRVVRTPSPSDTATRPAVTTTIPTVPTTLAPSPTTTLANATIETR